MLREIANLRQIQGEPQRRWFEGQELELIIWQNQRDEIIAFELYYDRHSRQLALRWETPNHYQVYNVDDGENWSGRRKGSPILMIAHKRFHPERVISLFNGESQFLETKIARWVSDKLLQYPGRQS